MGRIADRVAVRVIGSRMAAKRDESVDRVDSKMIVELIVSKASFVCGHSPAQRSDQT